MSQYVPSGQAPFRPQGGGGTHIPQSQISPGWQGWFGPHSGGGCTQ